MRRYLVTGGAGFIGSHLVAALLLQGKEVRVLDNFATGLQKNLKPFLSHIDFMQVDVRDLAAVQVAVAGMDVVLHMAGLPSASRSVVDPLESNQVNVTGTLNVLVASRDAGIQRIVTASSSSVYGNNPRLPRVETMPCEPVSPYAVSKLAAEHYCHAFAHVYGLPTIALRYFNVFGPGQLHELPYAAVIPRFIHSMLQGKPPIIDGDGHQSRDFTYIDDTVYATLLAAEATAGITGTFNVACGERISILSVVDHLNNILNTQLSPIHTSSRSGDVRHSQADIRKIRRVLGYTPRVIFDEGLRETVRSFAAHGSLSALM